MTTMGKIIQAIKYLVCTLIIISLVYMVWVHYGFVDNTLIYLMFFLYFMISLPWIYLCLSPSWWPFPKLKSKVMNVLFLISILLNMLPAGIVYISMCDEANSWKTNGWNGGRLDNEMEAFVSFGILAGLVYWCAKYALYIYLLHKDKQQDTLANS